MTWRLILVLALAGFGPASWLAPAFGQAQGQTAQDRPIEKEKVYLTGWDPDESVPAYFYYQKGNKAMPVVIFVHGLGGSKEQYGKQMQELAARGMFVVIVDAHLHGERRIPGIFPQGKSLGRLGEDYS